MHYTPYTPCLFQYFYQITVDPCSSLKFLILPYAFPIEYYQVYCIALPNVTLSVETQLVWKSIRIEDTV